MKKIYVTPAIKAANVKINSQILVGSGGSDTPDTPDPDSSIYLPFVPGDYGGQDRSGTAD